MTVAASARAERNRIGHRLYLVEMRCQFFNRANMFSILCRSRKRSGSCGIASFRLRRDGVHGEIPMSIMASRN